MCVAVYGRCRIGVQGSKWEISLGDCLYKAKQMAEPIHPILNQPKQLQAAIRRSQVKMNRKMYTFVLLATICGLTMLQQTLAVEFEDCGSGNIRHVFVE